MEAVNSREVANNSTSTLASSIANSNNSSAKRSRFRSCLTTQT